MAFFGRLPKLLVVFWLIEVAIVAVLWKDLPNQLSSILLVGLLVVNASLIIRRQFELAIFTNVALILALAHLWRSGGFASPLLTSMLIFAGVAVSGLITESTYQPIGFDNLLTWFVLALLVAEISSLIEYWPVTYLQKSLLCLISFYWLWRLALFTDLSRRTWWGHFIFTGLAVMVVVVSIIWTTWPGLKTF